jgi:hypothetical protein
MGRLSHDDRHALVRVYRYNKNISLTAKTFGVSQNTARNWIERANHPGRESFKDLPRHTEEKVTVEVEISILALRNTFNWGTGRIQQGLFCLPKHMLRVIPHCIQGLTLSRTTINNVLTRHGINGYEKQEKHWKFFRAKKPNELWQLDIKGPFTLQGKKYFFIVCIDDYSRYLLAAVQLDHDPTTNDIRVAMLPLVLKHKPKKILTDNGAQFKEKWKNFCRDNSVEAIFAHPYYPQDKGKVERAIRNVAEEFIYLLTKFPEWLDGVIKEYQEWYNEKRYHRGIHTIPTALFS